MRVAIASILNLTFIIQKSILINKFFLGAINST